MNSMRFNTSQFMEQQKQHKRKVRNLRPDILFLHYICLPVFLFTNTKASIGFLGDEPILFYIYIFLFSAALMLYSKACECPGYVDKNYSPKDIKDHYFCKECQMYIPIRASHCNNCGHCVLRRDHHCPWTNQCIGRDNHVYFYFWVITESILMLIVFLDVLFSMFNKMEITNWLKSYFLHIIFLPVLFFDLFHVASLTFTHTLMICNNKTVWEIKRAGSITYLQNAIRNPFDQGVFNNIIEFFTMKRDKKEWTVPEINLDDLSLLNY